MPEGKVWAYKDAAGNKYYRLLLEDGLEEQIPFLEGLTAQQSLRTLQKAIEEKFGEPCCLMIMNEMAAFDDGNGVV